jgi:hypothetical protein
MRTLLVCCLAVLAVAANINSPQPFKGQNTYVYRFDTQVSSSLIGASPAEIQQSAATRLRADVLLSFTNERIVKVQLQHVRIGELNSDLARSNKVQPLEHFERKEIPVELKQTLEMPLQASYLDGVFERINFHEDDSTWSKNIKRAALNMLQLNLKRNDVQGLKMQSSMPDQEENKDSPMFAIPEITLEGQCENIYVIQSQQRYSEQDERTPFNVTKTVNFNKCQKNADVSYGYQSNPAQELKCLNCLRASKQQQQDAEKREQARFGHCQSECQANKVNEDMDLERSTFARFELVGKPEKYSIKRSSMLSQYIVKAQNPNSQNTLIQVISVSEMNYKETLEGAQKVQTVKQSSVDDTIMYSNEWDVKEKRFYMSGDEEFEKSSPFSKVQKKEQKAGHAIRQILRQWSDKEQGYELDTAFNFNRLVDVVRKSSVKDLEAIEQVLHEIASQHEGQPADHSKEMAMSIFHDALAIAATRNSLSVLSKKIMTSEIKPAKAVQLLKAFATNQHSPSESQSNILERIAKHEVAHRSPALKQTAWLTFGQSVGSICQDKPSQSQKQSFRVEEICTRGKKEQYKKTLLDLWKQSESKSVYEQILALKVIGNAALDNMIEDLAKIVKDKSQPTLVRIEAIDALRRLRTSLSDKIRQTLLPIFQNQREQPEIRMASFSMIMYTQPEKSVLDQLTFTTIHDRSQNVKSFVLTTMEALSNSPSSAEQEIASHLKAALKMVRLEPEELRSSRKYRVPIYVSQQDNTDTEEQNIFVGLASIVSPTNMLPIQLSTSLRSAFNGESTEENLKLTISQKNLEQWYEKIAEYTQQYGRSSDDDKQGMERQSAKDLRQMYSNLGIKSRRHGSYYLSSEESDEQGEGRQQKKAGSNQPFGMIVLRTNDVDSTIIPISENQLPNIVRKILNGEKPSLSQYEELTQHLATGQHFRQHIAMTVGEKRTKIPTSSGLPLALTRQISAIGSVEGELNVKFESSDLESSRGLVATLKLRTSGIASHLHKAEVWSPVLISGVETQRTVEINAPIEMRLRADNKKAELKVKLPQDHRVRFAAIHTLPVTFVRQFDMQTRTQKEARVKTVHNFALEHTQREHQSSQWQESTIQIEGHYHHVTNAKQILQALFTTENNVHFYYKPSERTPKELTIRVSGSAFQKHSDHKRPEMDTFYSNSKGFQHIYSEDFEGMNLDNDETRRQSLSGYSQKYSSNDAYKHQIRVDIEANCGTKIHKASAELKGACDAGMKHCKLFLDAERTPLQSESQQWTMKAKIQTVAPESVNEDEDMSTKQSRMLVSLESEWGSERRNSMNIRLQAEPTTKAFWKPNSQSKWARFANKIDLVADYQLQPQQQQVVKRLYELLKAKLFWQLQVQDKQSNNGENVVRATIVIDPITKRHANISIQTPHERVRAQSIELPVRIMPYSLGRRQSSPIRSVGQLIQSVTNYGGSQCKVNERRVQTFDGVSYKAPTSECWSVLAKDCSRENPRFAVLMKKTEDEKKVKIVTQDRTIELISKQQQKLTVKVDGQKVTDEEELSSQGIEQSFNRVYVRTSSVNVEFDGEEVKIKVSGVYKNLQCGLCGHYNDEDEDVFRMNNGERSNSLKEFHKSYTLKNEECNESNLKKFYEQDSNEFSIQQRQQNKRRQLKNNWFDDDSDESKKDSDEQQQYESNELSNERQQSSGRRQSPKPIERTKIIEYQHRVCFSMKPVKKCPQGTVPDDSQTTTINVQFTCLDRSDVNARKLQRQVRQGKIVEMEQNAPSFADEVEQPTRCRQSVY